MQEIRRRPFDDRQQAGPRCQSEIRRCQLDGLPDGFPLSLFKYTKASRGLLIQVGLAPGSAHPPQEGEKAPRDQFPAMAKGRATSSDAARTRAWRRCADEAATAPGCSPVSRCPTRPERCCAPRLSRRAGNRQPPYAGKPTNPSRRVGQEDGYQALRRRAQGGALRSGCVPNSEDARPDPSRSICRDNGR